MNVCVCARVCACLWYMFLCVRMFVWEDVYVCAYMINRGKLRVPFSMH